MSKQLKSYSILTLTAMIWGFAFVAQLFASDIPPFVFNGARFLLGGLSLIPVILIFEKEKIYPKRMKITLKAGIIAGIILCIASNLQQLGVNITSSPAKSGFITGLYMIFVPIAGMFFKKKTSITVWIGAATALVGLYFLSFPNGPSAIGFGDIVLLVGAFCWTAHIMIIDSFGNKIYTLRFSMIQFLTCALMNIVCVLFTGDFDFSMITQTKYSILYAGLLSVGVAYTLQVIGQKNSDPTVASMVLSTESVFSAVGEMLFFGFIYTSYSKYTPLDPIAYVGCVIMFMGIIISQIQIKKKA